MRLAIFDLDGTIIRGTSCERILFRRLIVEGLIGPTQLSQYMISLARWWPRYGTTVLKRSKAFLAGLRVEKIESVAADLVNGELSGRFNPVVLEKIRTHSDSGYRTLLLTGAPQFLAEPLAGKLGMQHVIGSLPETKYGQFTNGLPLRHPFGGEKVRLAQAFCLRLGCEISEAAAYADSGHDLPLLEAAGRPVAVCPDRRLRSAAQIRKWEILE